MAKQYEPEFKLQLAKEAIETNNPIAVATKYNVGVKNIYNWVKNFKNKDQIAEQKEMSKLRKQLADEQLKNQMLTSLLKKTYQVWNSEDK